MHHCSQQLCWEIMILQWINEHIYNIWLKEPHLLNNLHKWWISFVYFVQGIYELMKSLFWNLKVSTFKCIQSRNWIVSVCVVIDASSNYHAMNSCTGNRGKALHILNPGTRQDKPLSSHSGLLTPWVPIRWEIGWASGLVSMQNIHHSSERPIL
jgi:hypothetical protein